MEHEGQVIAQSGRELLELEAEQASVDSELEDVVGDLAADPAHHLETLQHARDVADGHQVLDLQCREGAGDLVEALLVSLERGEGLVGAGQDVAAVLEDHPSVSDIEGDDVHRLTHRDHGEPGLLRDALGGAVAGAGLTRLDARVGHQVGGGPQDAGAVAVEDDRTVHLAQLAQAGCRELDVEREPAGPDLVHVLVVAQDDEGAGAAAEDALEAVAQLGPRRDGGQRGAQELVVGHEDRS